MICINLFGVPGSGKSTAAAYIFYRLKSLGVNCELVTEVAKDLVWDENRVGIETQMYVSGSQLYRLNRLVGKVDVVVTDAPLILQGCFYVYNNCPLPDMFQDIEYESSLKYDNLNYLLPSPDYVDMVGRDNRYVNDDIYKIMIQTFDKYNIDYKLIDRDEISYNIVVGNTIALLDKLRGEDKL